MLFRSSFFLADCLLNLMKHWRGPHGKELRIDSSQLQPTVKELKISVQQALRNFLVPLSPLGLCCESSPESVVPWPFLPALAALQFEALSTVLLINRCCSNGIPVIVPPWGIFSGVYYIFLLERLALPFGGNLAYDHFDDPLAAW